MELSSELISQFARITNDEPTVNEGSTVYATYRLQGESAYVQIDGSDTITPVATTAGAKSGDRVTVLVKDHKAIVTGNLTDPSANKSTVEEMSKDLGLGGRLEQVYNIVDPVNWTYTDSSGNIQTLTGKLGDMTSQVTGMAASIEGAAKVATNFIEFVNPYGLIIGDLTGSTLGFNTLIDATSLNMRYNDIVLAKYTANTIYLGYTSAVSEIVMCGGAGTIAAQNDASEFDADSLMLSSNNLILKTGGTVIQKIKMTRTGITLSSGSNSIIIDPYTNSGGVEVNGNLTVTGTLNATISGYAKENHTHNYYGYGDVINCQSIKPITDGDKACGLSSYRWSNIYCVNAEINTSDRNMKENIEPVSDKYIAMFDLLTPVSYKWIDGDRTHIGFISQHVREKMAEVGLTDMDFGGFCMDVLTDDDGNTTERYGLRYSEFIGIIAAKMKQLESRINELESKGVS